jgi:hypothetical protein
MSRKELKEESEEIRRKFFLVQNIRVKGPYRKKRRMIFSLFVNHLSSHQNTVFFN